MPQWGKRSRVAVAIDRNELEKQDDSARIELKRGDSMKTILAQKVQSDMSIGKNSVTLKK